MKICFFGIYDPEYSRNSILLKGLRQSGVDIVECRADWRDPKRYTKLWKALRTLNNDYDYIYAAYPSPVPTMLARLISKKPVISDAFYSMFDSVVNDRKKFKWFDPRSIKLLILDWLGLVFADLIIADTEAHKRYWQSWWGMKNKKFDVVYIGADDEMFRPIKKITNGNILVVFHGTFIPLQGVPKIVEAARICSPDPRIKFRLIGNGRVFPQASDLARKYNLKNLEFLGMMPISELNSHLAEADIVLGIFGDTAKARRVIPNKVYEGLQVRRPVITMNSEAIREIFTDKDLLIVNNDAQSIANGIITLAGRPDLVEEFARNGHQTVQGYVPHSIGQLCAEVIRKNT